MEFRLLPHEPLPEGVRRLAGHQLTKAIGHLEGVDAAGDEHIHEARKSLKRLRALVCLVRGELGTEAMRWENRSLGQAAQVLAGMRDAAALVECLDRLGQWSGKDHPRVRAWLLDRRSEGDADTERAAVTVVDTLRWAQVRLEHWPLQGREWEAIGPGVQWVYAQGRRALRRAGAEGGEEAFHQWRRYVKYLWYHTQLLEGCWPALMSVTQAALDQVGEALGDDHDLAVLGGVLRAEWPATRARREVAQLAALIPRQQAELQARALGLGHRLYAERPRSLTRRWERYWAVWRGEAPSEN